ncbi:MAG: cell wall hydrolase [Alphaproteobacteria bacterium]|nr:cell wall hydrolase [Alphaproteobacteria bacterium]
MSDRRYTQRDLDTLARTMWAESRGEYVRLGEDAYTAVAWVVKNRLEQNTWYGKTIHGVCTKPWQFSCWNEDDPNLPKLLAVTDEDPNFLAAVNAAGKVLWGNGQDPTGGADHYVNLKVAQPDWAMTFTQTAVIGAHTFFDSRR